LLSCHHHGVPPAHPGQRGKNACSSGRFDEHTLPLPSHPPRSKFWSYPLLIFLGVVAFSLLFLWLDNAYYRFAAARFPAVGDSVGLANLWGVVSRAHLLVLLVPLVLWRPRQMGFQLDLARVRQHWRLLLGMLLANCGVIAGYLWLTQSSTPYSGNQWLLTEVVTVPVVEETFWRGLVFAAARAAAAPPIAGAAGH
jgi:hypothetical protein